METVFQVSSSLVLPFWLLMVFAPRWKVTHGVMRSAAPILVLAGLYAVLVLPRIGGIWADLARPELEKVAALLGSSEGATIGWIHFLAFDLFVGRWIYLDSRERGVSRWLVGPILLLTLMFGPLGYLVYSGTRLWTGRRDPDAERLPPVTPKAPADRTGSFSRLPRFGSGSPALTATAFVSLAVLVPVAVGVFVDPRVITGAPAWLKPAKFLASVALYSLTLAWFLGQVPGRPRWTAWIANATTLGLGVELVIILVQAARGTTSHYNTVTPLDSILWQAMGGFILLVWLMGLGTAILLVRIPGADPLLAGALRWGMALALVGMAEGMFMARGGAHSVAVPDGGPGLPILGWSTTGGDLRVAHFLGLHAMQTVPLLAWLLGRAGGLDEGQRLRLLHAGAAGLGGLVLLTTWQALRGQPLLRPDALTWAALGALALGVTLAAGAALHPKVRAHAAGQHGAAA